MREVSPSINTEPSYSVCLHTSVVADVKRTTENVVEATLDVESTEKEITVRFFQSQT